MKNVFTLFLGIITFCCVATNSNAQSDTIPPVVLDFHIEFTDDALTDSIGAVFTLTYSENVELIDSFTIVTHFYNGGVWDVYDTYDSTEVVLEGNVLTITPERSFWASYRYEFIVISGSVKDLEGNNAGSFTRTFIADEDVPEVVDLAIELTENELKDSVSAVFTLTYNEDIKLSDNFAVVTHVFQNGVNPEYDRYDESEVTVDGNVITVSPERMFSMLERYELVVTFGSVTDLAGNWATSFTRVFVPDVTPPEVVDLETTFTDSEFADSLNVSFDLNYSEDVKLARTYRFVTYYKNAGIWEEYEQLTDSSIVVTGNTISLNPLRLYSSSGTYELVVNAGSVRDLIDNAATSFTNVFLIDTIRPKLIDISPDLTMPVAQDAVFTFTFDENVRLANNFGFYTYHWNADSVKYIEYERLNASQATVDNNVVTFDPSLDFMPEERVQIILVSGSVLDMEGNRFQYVRDNDTINYVSERFWTAQSGITVVNFLPRDDDSLTSIPDELTISFGESITLTDTTAVNSLSLDTLVYLRSNGIDLEHEAAFNTNTNVITITPAEKLNWGSSYSFGFTDGFLNEALDSVPAREATFTILFDYAIADVHGEGIVSPVLGQIVRITGTVTGINSGEGFFVQDENAARGGIWVEYTGTLQIETGDGVLVTGTVAEVNGITSIIADEVMLTDAPIVVEPIAINFGTDPIPMYRGVVVQITDARASAANIDGEWHLYTGDGADSIIVSSRIYAYSPVASNSYNVAGVVTFRDSIYRIEPRMEADVVDVTIPTSINLAPGIDFKVYPNPFNNFIKIQNDKLTRVIISNIAGQRVVDVAYPTTEINTSHLISGVYIITMFSENELVKTSRIVKQ